MPPSISPQSTVIPGFPGSCATTWRRSASPRTSKPASLFGKRGRDRVRERERAGQPWGFDAEELHQAEETVILRRVDDKIGGRLARTGEFRTDARIIREQPFTLEAGPIGADARVKELGPTGIDLVGFLVDPLDIRAEAHASRQID